MKVWELYRYRVQVRSIIRGDGARWNLCRVSGALGSPCEAWRRIASQTTSGSARVIPTGAKNNYDIPESPLVCVRMCLIGSALFCKVAQGELEVLPCLVAGAKESGWTHSPPALVVSEMCSNAFLSPVGTSDSSDSGGL